MQTVIALGFFDGVHLGHRALLTRTAELAAARGWRSVALTFDRSPGKDGRLLTTVEDRIRLIREGCGIDEVRVLAFTEEFKHRSWDSFLAGLVSEFRAAHLVCGWDYRFGCRGEGNPELLQAWCAAHGLGCDVIPRLTLDGITVSATFLKTLVEAGDVEAAARYYGHPHLLTGVVQPGKGLGHTLGFPTANLLPPPELLLPRDGVYAVRATVEGRVCTGVCNVGTNPTVAGRRRTVETWLADFDGDLYGRELTVEFHRFLREEQKFPSLEALKEEIFRNQQQAQAFFTQKIKEEKTMNPNRFFPEIHGKFGFGCMRFPKLGEEIDQAQVCQMVDAFLEAGFNYFDTAHGYHSGLSETTLKACLSSRYPRERYLLTDKLTDEYFQSEADIRPLFAAQLEACGVEYFDFYLMHAQNIRNFQHFKACRAYETAFALKAEGKIRHVGISFHDTAENLETILETYPEIECVQIQFNYLDDGDVAVDSRRVYEVCAKHGKPVIIMEPIKGGTLTNLPEEAMAFCRELGKSPAELALRYAAAPEQVFMVLSGMSSLDQMRENVGFMADALPLSEAEAAAVNKIRDHLRSLKLIGCTGCRYCVDGCPMGILIPDMFQALDFRSERHDWNQDRYYRKVLTVDHGKASDCIGCGACEMSCPQSLPIRDYLEQIAARFEKKRDEE